MSAFVIVQGKVTDLEQYRAARALRANAAELRMYVVDGA